MNVLMYPTLGTSADGTEVGRHRLGSGQIAAQGKRWLLDWGNDEQKDGWLRAIATGEAMFSESITEKNTGSSFKAMTVAAVVLLEWCADLAPLGLHTRLRRALDRATNDSTNDLAALGVLAVNLDQFNVDVRAGLSRGRVHGASQVRASQNCEVSA